MLTDAERRELTLRLLGTGKRGEPPGPLDAGWVVQHLAGTRTTLQRWREVGIPPSRLDEVLGAVRGLVPETQKEAAPDVPGRLDEIERKLDQVLVATSSLVETSPDLQDALRALIERIEDTQPQGGEAPLETDPESDRVEQRPEDRGVG